MTGRCAHCGEMIRHHSDGTWRHFDREAECGVVNWWTGARLHAEPRAPKP